MNNSLHKQKQPQDLIFRGEMYLGPAHIFVLFKKKIARKADYMG
jgi:hypothetical protein